AQVSSKPRLAEGQMVVAIPVRTDAAAGGRIRANDPVLVIATDRKDASSRVVLDRVSVYDVGRDSGSSIARTPSRSASGTLAAVTLIVDQDPALKLTRARWTSGLDVALLPAQ